MPSSRDHTLILAGGIALFDTGSILISYVFAIFLVSYPVVPLLDGVRGYMPYAVVFIAMWYFQAYDQRLFLSRRIDALLPQLLTTTRAIVISLVLTIFVMALLSSVPPDRVFIAAFSATILGVMLASRMVVRFSLWGLRRRGYNYRRILMIGSNERTAHAAEVIQSNEHFGFMLAGFLDNDESRRPHLERFSIPYLGRVEDLEHILVDHVIDVVYISLPVRSHYGTIQSIAHLCEGVGVPVRLIADLFPMRIAGSRLLKISDVPILAISGSEYEQPQTLMRRLTDFAVSSLLLAILSPLFGLLSALIKLDSPGPVFVSEDRISARTFKQFRMITFRTLVSDANEDQAAGDAPALTRFGGWLRRYGLHELPTLINIWKGEMSMTDPRPQLAAEIDDEAEAPNPG